MRTEIRRQVENLLQCYESEPEHVRQVSRLADLLFVGLQDWHQLGEEYHELLQVASLLHDIGWSQTPTGSGHHKHSARLIRDHPWEVFAPHAVKTVSLVARYHRKAIPKPTHLDYCALKPENQRVVGILGGMLRVADALDRTHTSVVQSMTVTLGNKEVVLDLIVNRPCPMELQAIEKKKDLLELVTHKTLVVNVPSTFIGTSA